MYNNRYAGMEADCIAAVVTLIDTYIALVFLLLVLLLLGVSVLVSRVIVSLVFLREAGVEADALTCGLIGFSRVRAGFLLDFTLCFAASVALGLMGAGTGVAVGVVVRLLSETAAVVSTEVVTLSIAGVFGVIGVIVGVGNDSNETAVVSSPSSLVAFLVFLVALFGVTDFVAVVLFVCNASAAIFVCSASVVSVSVVFNVAFDVLVRFAGVAFLVDFSSSVMTGASGTGAVSVWKGVDGEDTAEASIGSTERWRAKGVFVRGA